MTRLDLDEEVFTWKHPRHGFASRATMATLGAAALLLGMGVLLGAVGRLTLSVGPEPVKYVNCWREPALCEGHLPPALDALPDWSAAYDAAENRLLDELVQGRYAAELDLISARHAVQEHQSWEPAWSNARAEWRRALPSVRTLARSVEDWKELFSAGIPSTPPAEPLPERPWTPTLVERVREASREEANAWGDAEHQVRTSVYRDVATHLYAEQHALWEQARRNANATWLGILAGALGAVLLLVGAYWRRAASISAPFEMVVGRHAVRFRGRKVSLVEATDAELYGLLRELRQEGYRQPFADSLLGALQARRDAAQRGDAVSAEDRAGLAALLDS